MKNIRLLMAFAFACLFLPHAAIAKTIHSGSAPIDQALQVIVPSKFKVVIDEKIPRDLNMSWPESPNWMVALVQATRKAGLQIQIAWDKSLLRVALPASPVVVAASAPRASVAPVVPAAAPTVAVVADAPKPAAALPSYAPPVPSETARDDPLAPSGAITTPSAVSSPASAPPVQAIAAAPDAPLMAIAAEPVNPSPGATSVAPVVVETAPPAPPAVATHVFGVSRQDKTVRETLQRWAAEAGWTHEPEHWQVPRDLPINATDRYDTDFRTAVRALLASSRFTDLPVQPCFHSNKVVRVVAEAELCDKHHP
jgi:hypothetical protein